MNNRSGDGFMDAAVVGAAIVLFPRTADIMSYFSPTILNDIIGRDVSLIYGLVTGSMVEGLALALHFNRRAALSSIAQWVKWTLILISGMCQVFDGYIITDTLAQQTDTIKTVFQYGVPLIPLLIMIMIFGIGHLPDSPEPKKHFVGLKNIPATFSWIWNGADEAPKKGQTTAFHSDVRQPKNNNEDKSKGNP